MIEATFRLDDKFIRRFQNIKAPFGFNGLGEFVYLRTYSRIKEDGTNEVWYETVRRVVEGTYRMQERHIKSLDLGWSNSRAQKSAQEMYDRIFQMKFLPPGRGLWAMGSELTEKRSLHAALNNCAFTSTEYIDKDGAEPFCFLMDASMLGIGVGFDLCGAGKVIIKEPTFPWDNSEVYRIPDSREGWVKSVKLLIESYFNGSQNYILHYDDIRPKGLPIKGFGGISSGPEPLRRLHEAIRRVLHPLVGKPITEEAIADIMNLIGVCVVAGNVRRTAEIMFGSPYSQEYLHLKDYRWDAGARQFTGPRADRAMHGWTSNNSVFADIGMDYRDIAELTYNNGEPGFMWLENARNYGRMVEEPNSKDKRVQGANPCAEQSLEHGELCCLVETFPNNCVDKTDYSRTLKFAYLYAKTVTLGKTHWPKTNKVMLRNRRIGTSLSGIQQFIAVNGINKLREWSLDGYAEIEEYDRIYSEWLCVPRSIKTTSIKPSGTVSLLAGATPGMHWPESRYCIRRVRVAKTSQYVERFREALYTVEDCVDDQSSVVVEFPIDYGYGICSVDEVSIWEQFEMAAFLQKYWADNQVSCTVTFDPKKVTKDEIARCLEFYQFQLKGISLLPKIDGGAYPQMPYEAITEDVYCYMMESIKPLNLSGLAEEAIPETGCATDVCEIKNWSNDVAR